MEYYSALWYYAKEWGLSDKAARAYATLMYWAGQYGYNPAPIISGLRDRQWTINAQKRWDMGERAGLAVRPATNSRHLTGNAFDVQNTPQNILLFLGDAVSYLPGTRWGGNFRIPDPNHFDVE